MDRALNEELLVGNTCFGCGPEQADGLRIRIFKDGSRTDRLVGEFVPREAHTGFPRIVHGGLQFTALDCLAGWTMFVLRAPPRSMPLTVTASMRFLKPAVVGERLRLTAEVVREQGDPRQPLLVHTELLGPSGEPLSTADFEYIALPAAKFQKAVGIDALPDSYRRHFGDL